MYFKTYFKKRAFQNAIGKNRLHGCSGHKGRAFSKSFAQKIYWPNDAPEDTYSFLLCNKMGYEIVNASKAKIYYRLPGNFKDYYRQYTKFIRGRQALIKYFPENEITKLNNYRSPLSALINEFIKAAIKNPLMVFLYICALLTVHLRNFRMGDFHPLLEIYPSSKKLI